MGLLIALALAGLALPALADDAKTDFAYYVDVAPRAGLTAKTIIGEENVKRFILESTGGGVALIDYDDDGWLDVFLTTGSRLNGFDGAAEPVNRLYHNNADGSFTDVTARSGLGRSGWAQGVCAGDYDGDARLDLYVTYWGENVLYRNRGDGSFEETTQRAGLKQSEKRYGTGCTFVDYDRDGDLDLFVANYVDYSEAVRELPHAESVCRWKGLRVFCGPKGLRGSGSVLYQNQGNGAFVDVSRTSKVGLAPPGNGFTAIAADFDNDGWPDIYVANDATPSLLFRNTGDGAFEEIGWPSLTAVSADGLEQAGMGVDVADYDGDGFLDIVKTNFSNDIPTLYRSFGENLFNDVALGSGLHLNRQHLGWGVAFADVDADSWPDIFIANGHVYPGIEKIERGASYKQGKLLYRNLGNGRFADASADGGPGVRIPRSARGMAKGDVFNTGRIDFVLNNMWDPPELLHNQRPAGHWIQVRLIGEQTNSHGIGSRVRVYAGERTQLNEVRSGGSFCSQTDLRLYFGLGSASRVDRIEVDWLGGRTERLTNVDADQLIVVRQGAGIVERHAFPRRDIGF